MLGVAEPEAKGVDAKEEAQLVVVIDVMELAKLPEHGPQVI